MKTKFNLNEKVILPRCDFFDDLEERLKLGNLTLIDTNLFTPSIYVNTKRDGKKRKDTVDDDDYVKFFKGNYYEDVKEVKKEIINYNTSYFEKLNEILKKNIKVSTIEEVVAELKKGMGKFKRIEKKTKNRVKRINQLRYRNEDELTERSIYDAISKIEKHEALGDIDNIIKLSDGIMVARGDLGVELPLEKVALIQKSIIKKCNKSGKPVITATQMLESMIHNSRPTRAEVTDTSNAILDGTDAVMLSGETAVGKYPLEAVKTIVRIARYVEKSLDYSQVLFQRHRESRDSITEVMSFSACESALHLKAKAIVAPTRSGRTARMVSRYRPKAMIIAPTPCKSVLMQLCLSWGVYAVLLSEKGNFESLVAGITNILKKMNLLRKNDRFIITGGSLKNRERSEEHTSELQSH